jgi:hypothetical protein
MNGTVDLLNALCAHLTEFELPAIASVHVGTAPRSFQDRVAGAWY